MPVDDEPIDLVRDGWRHVQLQRPLAAWACWQRALRIAPGHPAAAEALAVLAAADDLPAAARATYRFRSPRGEECRHRWDAALKGRDLADLGDAALAFAAIADEAPDADALHSLALCLAWAGRNAEAVDALGGSVDLDAEARPDVAASAWLLAEVLRLGAGAEQLADDHDHALIVDWPDGDPASLGHLRPLPIEGESTPRAYEWLDRPIPPVEAARSAADLPRVLASVVRSVGTLRVSTPDPRGPLDAELAITAAYPDRPIARESRPLPLRLADADAWRVRLPTGLEPEPRRRLAREAIESYYESTWMNLPRLGLDGLSPRDASTGGHVLRAKLLGVIAFREQLADRALVAPIAAGYPFDRLRRRLGLAPRDESILAEVDPTMMGLDELRRLDPSTLDPSRRAEAAAASIALGDPANAQRLQGPP